ncbi:MAG: hypothetical protein CVV03_07665 [Firmicutes bacterium HGW-Firmicutes-8]|nr:MAG: hypothetical protein CVV03_07665 [Firmicutes bacterium HGW-Firmicutes-8]
MSAIKRKIIVLITMIALLIFPTWSYAALMGVMGWDSSHSGTAYGTFGYNYVMAAPNVDSMHVSSIYVRSGNTHMCEAGWFASSDDIPKFFNAWMINGIYSERIWENAPKDSNHRYQVENTIGTNWWKIYIDGVNKFTVNMNGWTHGDSVGTSERNLTTDTNYSHFWSMKYKNSSGTFNSWQTGSQYYDNDPGYKYSKTSNTEFYVVQG